MANQIDFSKLSDAELRKIAGIEDASTGRDAPDLSKMSDAELHRIIDEADAELRQMAVQNTQSSELQQLWGDLQDTHVWSELGLLLLALVLATGLCCGLRRGAAPGSILFGRRLFDGVLWPFLLWLQVVAYKLAMGSVQHLPVLKLALPILSSLVVIRLIARVMAAVFPSSPLARLTERGVSWLAWAVAVLWITGWGEPLLDQLDAVHLVIGKAHVSLRDLIDASVLSVTVLVLTLWLSAVLEQRVLNRAVADLSMRKIAVNALRVVLLLNGGLFVLAALGVDLTALSVLGGALGVGLGFGLQKLASNYISGFVILIERSLRIGDYVRVADFEGRVADIKTRYTLLHANNGSEAVVPNELLITQRVDNLSLADSRFLLACHFWLTLEADPVRAQTVLVDAIRTLPCVLAEPQPKAFLAEVDLQGLKMQLNFWIADAATGQLSARSEVNLAVLQALRAAGFTLAHAAS